MNFEQAPLTEDYTLMRMVSTCGTWELGYRQMLFGVRVSVAQVGALGPCVDYCCGPDPEFRAAVLWVLLTILDKVEIVPTCDAEMTRIFPHYDIKPLFNDPLWPKLLGQACALDPNGGAYYRARFPFFRHT